MDCVVNSVEISGAQKYLVMKEISKSHMNSILNDHQQMEACDVICLTYDSSNPESFSFVADLRVSICFYLTIILINLRIDFLLYIMFPLSMSPPKLISIVNSRDTIFSQMNILASLELGHLFM